MIGTLSGQLVVSRRRDMIVATTVCAVAIAFWLLPWRGVDYPAQVYRVDLVRRFGFTFWDTNWYGGHFTPGYGVAFPWLASVTGMAVPAIASTAGSVALFTRLLRRERLPHVLAGSFAFAFLMLINLYEGRLPFGLGLFFGLTAVTLSRNDRWMFAGVATVLAALSSPVSGVFTALAFVAWTLALHRDRWRALQTRRTLGAASLALATALSISLAFPEGGWFPYADGSMLLLLGAAALVWKLLPVSLSAVRWGFTLGAVAAVPIFFVPNPMGANLSRLVIIGAPILCAAPRRRPVLHVLVCVVLLGWQSMPLLRVLESAEDPSARAAYYQPLITAIEVRTNEPVRLEIPFTSDHWEAAYVAPSVPLARGWERQLDLRYNQALYDQTLDSESYRDWLYQNGVSYVAVPDVPLEPESQREAAVASSASYLQEVWHNDHWQLYQVQGTPGLLTGKAELLELDAENVRLDVHEAGPLTLRMRYNSHLTVAHNRGCVYEDAAGWTRIDAFKAGPLMLTSTLIAASAHGCPET